MTDEREQGLPVKSHISNGALLDKAGYEAMYQASVENPDAFWGEQGKILDWMKPYTKVKNTSYDPGHVSIKWFEDGQLNVSANCLDRTCAIEATRSPSSGKGTTRPRIAS